MGYLWVN